jgi:hypothetical protein
MIAMRLGETSGLPQVDPHELQCKLMGPWLFEPVGMRDFAQTILLSPVAETCR